MSYLSSLSLQTSVFPRLIVPLSLRRLFYGKARQSITFPDRARSTENDKEVIFSHVLINVGETGSSKDLHDGLGEYYQPEEVQVDGKTALLQEVPAEFPKMLHVQMQVRQAPVLDFTVRCA